jgi:hypothetical protein
MSERGWREFLNAKDLDDWVVLHGGAAAVFVVPTPAEAARLAAAVAEVPGLAGSGALLTVVEDNGADPLGHGSTVWMQDLDPEKPLRHAMHVDVSWILADRAGNRVCVAAWPDGALAESPALTGPES